MTQVNPNTQQLMTIKELAEFLNISEKTIRNLRSKGEGPRAVKIGGSVRWRRETVEQYIRQQEELDTAAQAA